MECKNCSYELTHVYASRSVELEQPGPDNTWVEKNVFMSGCVCPSCHASISTEDLDEMGVPVEWR